MNKSQRKLYDGMPFPGEPTPDGSAPAWAVGIKPDYDKIQRVYLKMCLSGSFTVFLFEIGMIVVFWFHLLPLEFKTSVFVHFLKYLIIPATMNFGVTAAAYWIVTRKKYNEFVRNAAPVIAMAVICAVTASAHSVYPVTLLLFCIPVFMASIYGVPRLVYMTCGIGALGLLSAWICRSVSPYWRATVDTKLIPEIIAAYVVLLMVTSVSLTMIRLLETQKKRLLTAVREGNLARQEAQAANRAKSEFLANMSHEIRTPLNAVVSMTEMILRKSENPEILEYAGDIRQASNLLLAIISDILDISKIESGKMKLQENRYELGSLINDSYNMVAARGRDKGLAMEVTCDPMLPRTLYGDEFHLRQIVVNLLSNAVKYTNVGGVEFRVMGEKEGGILRMELLIKDTGVGIRKEDIPRVFEKFSRVDLNRNRSVEGTGLGLSITKQLVTLMNGTIDVESVYGIGTAFTVRVPQKIVDETPIGDIRKTYLDIRSTMEEYHQSFEAPEARILVVDDVQINLEVVRRLLESTKLKVDTALSGEECLKMVCKTRYDLILMDHMMPQMDGVETLKAMAALPDSQNAGVPVIMLTANAMMGAREKYLEMGFADYLAKPIRGARLEAVILKYLPKERISWIRQDMEQPEEKPVHKGLRKLLPELDMVSGMSYCADDEIFYRQMLQEFACGGWDEKLKAALAAENWASYQVEAHSVKSAARMVGLTSLSDECLELETAAKDGDVDKIRAKHSALIAHYHKVVDVLKNLRDGPLTD